jgi:hypothetical protein
VTDEDASFATRVGGEKRVVGNRTARRVPQDHCRKIAAGQLGSATNVSVPQDACHTQPVFPVIVAAVAPAPSMVANVEFESTLLSAIVTSPSLFADGTSHSSRRDSSASRTVYDVLCEGILPMARRN